MQKMLKEKEGLKDDDKKRVDHATFRTIEKMSELPPDRRKELLVKVSYLLSLRHHSNIL